MGRLREFVQRLTGSSRVIADQWLRRSLFVVGGLAVGGAAVLMAKLADGAQAVFREILAVSPWIALGLTPLGFAGAVWLARHVFPNSQGSGIPQVIAAREIENPVRRDALVSLRVAFGKIVVMTMGLLCGASIGREGPTVQVGAALMAAAGRLSPERLRGLLLAGGAAGVAAAFNTPLAGIVFAIEELSRSFEAKTSGLVVTTIIAAGLTSLALVGDYSYFGKTAARLPFGADWIAVAACGVLGGLAGGLFGRIVIAFGRGLPGRSGAWILRRPVVFAALCGLGVALCGLLTGGHAYGTGYEQARALLHGTEAVHEGFAPAKFAATVLSSISGIPGGLFAPSLAVGAGLGAEVARLFTAAPPGALVLIGMVAYLAGTLQAPITAFVIVSEMTETHAMMIPLMIAALIADATAKLICPHGLYHALAALIVAEAAPATREPEGPVRDLPERP